MNLGNTNTVLLMVPYEQEGGMVCGKPFMGAKQWAALTQKEGYITFREKDFFAYGTYEETPVFDKDYPAGFFEYMKQSFDDVYCICSVAKFKTVPHFELGGK